MFWVFFLFLFPSIKLGITRPKAPTASDWSTLNVTVHGRLIRGVPFARPCFQLANGTTGDFSSKECSMVAKGYLSQVVRSHVFGAYLNNQWETCPATSSRCLLDSTSPSDPIAYAPPKVCGQGSVPDFAIDVRTAADAIAGFKFAKRHGIPLVIKNTGHDTKGRSSAPNSLALWMRNIRSISFDREFIPSGCPSSRKAAAVTYGAGVNSASLVSFADVHNLTIPTGGDSTVGAAGGYIQGGGHSALSNALGLAVDRILEFEVVTPSGQHIKANRCKHPDLFFALRGGGGGTFCAVLKATVLALPKMSITAVLAKYDPIRENQRKVVKFMTDHALEFAEEGWGGYINPLRAILFANPILNETRAIETIEPLRQFIVQELEGSFTLSTEPSYKSFYDHWIKLVIPPTGAPSAISSRLVPADNFQTAAKREELTLVIDAMLDQVQLPVLFATTPFYYGDKGGTSVNPVWRTSLWHVALGQSWSYNASSSAAAAMYARLTTSIDPLRRITPGSGAYVNEADVYEPDFEASFWGNHYQTLLAIKRKYDPDHILDCWQCVGWLGANAEQYQCYLPMTAQGS